VNVSVCLSAQKVKNYSSEIDIMAKPGFCEVRCAVEDEFREITQNNDHYAVQGHSRLPILVPMESTYATFYV